MFWRKWMTGEVTSGGFFLVASLGSGLINYLFQVTASRNLSATDFSALNGWYADLAMLFLLGGILTYSSVFSPAPRTRARMAVLGLNVLVFALLVAWFGMGGETLSFGRAIIILLTSYCMAWMMGQVQIRLAFFVISLVNLSVGLTKLGCTWLPVGAPSALDRYALAWYACMLPAIWLMSAYLWSSPEPEVSRERPVWAPVIALSIATSVIPQFDLVVMHHSLDTMAFAEFARASLFYRAIFVVIFILAQWLLPRQIRDRQARWLVGWPLLIAFTVALSGALTLMSPLISTYVLNWSTTPEAWLIFLSCLHMSTLALLFLCMQKACAIGKPNVAFGVLAVLAAEAAAQWTCRFEMTSFLAGAIVIEGAILLWAWRGGKYV